MVGNVISSGKFLNFALTPDRQAVTVVAEVERLGQRYGHDDIGNGQTAVVEYSSPNMARRMHVGHVRSTIIGHSLANILAALDYDVARDNHIGDWGKNFGILLTAINHEGLPDGEDETALATLERLYAIYNRLAEED